MCIYQITGLQPHSGGLNTARSASILPGTAINDSLHPVFLSLVLKNVEEDHLNDSLGNPGLISPDKEDLSRLLV